MFTFSKCIYDPGSTGGTPWCSTGKPDLWSAFLRITVGLSSVRFVFTMRGRCLSDRVPKAQVPPWIWTEFAVRFWLGEFESACSTLQAQGDGCSGSTKGAFTNIGPLWHCIYIALKLELRSFQPCFGHGISRGFSFVSVCGRACGGGFCYCHGTLGILELIESLNHIILHDFTTTFIFICSNSFFFDTCILV